MTSTRLNDADYDRLRERFKTLFTPKVSQKGRVSLRTVGNTVLFTEAGEQVTIQNNDKVVQFLNSNGISTGQEIILESVRIEEDGIVFVVQKSPGSIEYNIQVQDPNKVLHELFDGYNNNDKINYGELVNEVVEDEYTVEDKSVQLVKVNNRYYQLKVNGKRYDYSVVGKVTVGDKIYAYVNSKAFSGMRPIVVSQTSKLLTPETHELLAYIPYSDDESVIYTLNGNTITRIEAGHIISIVPKELTQNGIIIPIENGVEETLEFNRMIPEQVERLKKLFGTERVKFGDNVKVLKHKNT